MAAPILTAKHLGKRFDLRESVWDYATSWVSRDEPTDGRGLWAVRDVSFEMARGQILGLIGANGAGKSTLVKLITGALDPTEGSSYVDGRVFSLPELGTDLNDDLTGRENVLVGAQLLNLPVDYAESRLEQILEFSELGEFFDRRVRTYSTGMRMRLAFSTFAFLDCDLLILDEVMAVGDIFFQQKCYERITQLIEAGRSILMITHDLNAIQHYCDEVIVMHQGNLAFQGNATDAIQAFVQLRGVQTSRSADMTFSEAVPDQILEPVGFQWPRSDEILLPPSGKKQAERNAEITRLALCDQRGRLSNVFQQGETAVFYFEIKLHTNIGVPVALLEISNQYNILIHSKNSLQLHVDAPMRVHAGQRLRFCQRIQLGLEPADYVFSIGLLTLHPGDYVRVGDMTQQDFNERLTWVCRQHQAGALVVTFGFSNGKALTHAGLADLPGDCQMRVLGDPPIDLEAQQIELASSAAVDEVG